MQYVGYFVLPRKRSSGTHLMFSDQATLMLRKKLDHFISTKPDARLLEVFMEIDSKQRHRSQWPQLDKAIHYCQEENATLLIAELRNLANNEDFSNRIIAFIQSTPTANIVCVDQPFINKDNFIAIAEHAKQQRKMHGELIKAGLSKTFAKSGNPNAAAIIHRVNKPKTDNAILYAMMLQPIIVEYKNKGYSQRKMVEQLNENGFTAPEGGKWVLSQLQKVIERMQFTQTALESEASILEYQNQGYSIAQIAETLNTEEPWIEKILDRLKEVHDIIKLNQLLIQLTTLLPQHSLSELNESVLRENLPSHYFNDVQEAEVSL